jgi:DNA repair protein RecO (recombination protein O)
MSETTQKTLVLAAGRFKESDVWLRLLSAEQGVFTAFAFGGCRSRRRFCGCLEPLSHVLFHLRSSRTGTYVQLAEGALLEAFPGVRADPARLGLAVNCARFTAAVQLGPEGAPETLGLLLELLRGLEEGSDRPPHLAVAFRARVLAAAGHRPALTACQVCGAGLQDRAGTRAAIGLRLCVDRGGALCADCAAGERGLGLQVSLGALRSLERICGAGPGQWRNLALAEPVRGEVYRMVDALVEYHLGLRFEGGKLVGT